MSESYESKRDVIDSEINKRRSKWQLKAVTWMDFDDVRQILRIHIFEKWHLWDQSRPIEPWLNTLIGHQMINIIRDNFWSFSRPCLKCHANQGGELCGIYGKQCLTCPLYRKWHNKKKGLHDLKMASSFNDERNPRLVDEIVNEKDTFIDYNSSLGKVHSEMRVRLKPDHYEIYKMLYVDNLSEDVVAEKFQYKETQKK
jgi:hypothetical protein